MPVQRSMSLITESKLVSYKVNRSKNQQQQQQRADSNNNKNIATNLLLGRGTCGRHDNWESVDIEKTV